MKIVGIYKITSPTGKVYIGQSTHLRRRKNEYQNLRCTRQPLLYKSLKKYSWKAHTFEIVHLLPTDVSSSVLDTYEQLYMDFYRDAGIKLLNLKEGGKQGRLSAESREKLRLANLGRKDKGMYGKRHSDNSRKRMSEKAKGRIAWNKGKTTPLEIREKQRIAALSRKYTDESYKRQLAGRTGKAPWNKGMPTSAEQIKKFKATIEVKRRAKCAA